MGIENSVSGVEESQSSSETVEHSIDTDYKLIQEFAAENKDTASEHFDDMFYYTIVTPKNGIDRENYEALIRKGLTDPDMREIVTQLAGFLPEGNHADLIAEGLRSDNPRVRENILHAVSRIPEDQRAKFVIDGCADKNETVRMYSIMQVSLVQDEQTRLQLVKEAVADDDWGVRYAAESAIAYVPMKDRAALLTEAFQKTFEGGDAIGRAGILQKALRLVPPQDLESLIELGLNDDDPRVRIASTSMITSVPSRRVQSRLNKVLSPDNRSIWKKIGDF